MRDQALNPPISPEGGGCKACIVVQKVSLLVIIEKPNFVNIWKTMHDNIMKLVSTHMFHGQGLSYCHLKCCSIICILCVCK